MNRQVRLSRLLQILHTHPLTPVEELAARLGVSDRTIYRDLEKLKEDGVHINRKARTGYSVRPDDAPIALSRDELEALALGAQMVGAWGDPALSAAAIRMLDKVAGALPAHQQRVVDRTAIGASRAQSKFRRVAGLGSLRRALSERRKVYFRYLDIEGHRTERVVQPRSLVFRGDHWSLLAWCEIREEYRSFRPERMRDVCLLEETYTALDAPSPADDDDPAFEADRALEAALEEEDALAPIKVSA